MSIIYDKGSCAGTGAIVASSQTWIPPSTLDSSLPIKQGMKAGFFLVSIDKVNIPALKTRDIYLSGTRKFATLGDIGVLPARIMIPVDMLRPHVPKTEINKLKRAILKLSATVADILQLLRQKKS